jgi:hypothetical protein
MDFLTSSLSLPLTCSKITYKIENIYEFDQISKPSDLQIEIDGIRL